MRTYCPFLLLALYSAPFRPENKWPEHLSGSPGVPTFYFPHPSFLYLFCILSLGPYRQVKEEGAWEEESILYLFLLMFWWQETKTHYQRKYWAVGSWHTKVASPQPFFPRQPVSSGSSLLYLVKFELNKSLGLLSRRQCLLILTLTLPGFELTVLHSVCMLSTVPMALYSDAVQLCWSTHGLSFLHHHSSNSQAAKAPYGSIPMRYQILQDCSDCGLQGTFCEGDSRAYPWPPTLLNK